MCSFDGCGRDTRAKGLCIAHYNQQNRGETLRPLRPHVQTNLKKVVTYYSAHTRVLVAKGPAKGYPCVDNCGKDALDWSLRKTATVVVDDRGRKYSLNPEDYEPRCRSCHMIYDESGGNPR